MTTKHCRPDYNEFQQRATCCHCGEPLLDNDLVKDAYKVNLASGWAKQKLDIFADMMDYRGIKWFPEQLREVSKKLTLL